MQQSQQEQLIYSNCLQKQQEQLRCDRLLQKQQEKVWCSHCLRKQPETMQYTKNCQEFLPLIQRTVQYDSHRIKIDTLSNVVVVSAGMKPNLHLSRWVLPQIWSPCCPSPAYSVRPPADSKTPDLSKILLFRWRYSELVFCSATILDWYTRVST